MPTVPVYDENTNQTGTIDAKFADHLRYHNGCDVQVTLPDGTTYWAATGHLELVEHKFYCTDPADNDHEVCPGEIATNR